MEIENLILDIVNKLSCLEQDMKYIKASMCPTQNVPKELTVEQAFTHYINSRSNILSPATLRGYRIIKTSRLQLIKDIPISELNISDVQNAVNEDSKRLSQKSLKSALALLKSVLDTYDIEFNIKKIAVPQLRPQKMSIPNVEDVLKVIIGSELELPSLLAIWLSLRISEVRGLQFRDVSNDGRYISVCRSRICLDGKDVLRDCNKTEKSTRTNLLPPYILNLIRQVPHKKDTDFIVNRSYEYIRRHFKQLMNANGFEITFHKLRHEFATTLNDLGVPCDYIQKLGGWSTDNIMKTVYTHTTDSKENEYQTIVDKFFTSAISKIKNNP